MNSTQQYLVEEELEQYRDGYITRREFMRRAGLFGVGTATAAALAQTVVPRAAVAAPLAQNSPFSVAADDPTVASDTITFSSTDGATLLAYRAWPAGASEDRSHPAIIICHENRGLTPHIQDVARRYARQGYVALAPDLPSRFGRPAAELAPDEVMAAFGRLEAAQNARDFQAGLALLHEHPAVDPAKTAATGFCFGGGVIWRLATIDEQLTAAAPFYGSTPPLADVARIKAAMLGVYAGTDDRINASWPELEAALQAAGVTYRRNLYPNVNHGFHNDTGNAYNREAAMQAYIDALTWFADHLGLPAPQL